MCRIRLELYATRSTRDLLVLGLLLLLLVITVKFHCFCTTKFECKLRRNLENARYF